MKKPGSRIHYTRIPAPLYFKLMQISDEECRTIASVINQAVKEFIERRAKSGK